MDAKQDVWRAIPALMGNGSGIIEVPNQPGYVYIRIGDGDLGQAFNNRCPLRDNLAIYVGYDPVTDPERRIFQVLSVRMSDYANSGNTPIVNVPAHHTYHEFGGGDDIYIDWRRLLGFRVGRPAAFVVTVDQGVMMRAGAWAAITSQTVDLTASKPGGVNNARYTLISLNAAGTITKSDGAIVSAALLDISDCLVPAAGEIPLAAVRLYSSQTQISDIPSTPDIIDLRFPQTYVAGGSNVFGAGTQYQLAVWTDPSTLAGLGSLGTLGSVLRSAGVGANPAWSTFYLSGTAGGTTNFAVTNTKTLTLTATDSYNLTVPATGTAALGIGAADTLTKWSATNVLTNIANAAGYLKNDGAGGFSYVAAPLPGAHNVLDSTYHSDVLTGAITRGDLLYGNATPKIARLALGGAAGAFVTRDANDVLWSGFYLSGTAAQTYTFPAAGGTVAMLNAANAFTDSNTIASGKFLTCLTDGTTGGFRAGSGSDVLWYRSAIDTWRTPNKAIIEGDFTAGQNDAHTNTLYGTTIFRIGIATGAIFDVGSGNWKIAGTATRATTEGTNHLDIFDGTAPVGTLANGVSLYSASGFLRIMDSAGNASTFGGGVHVGGTSDPGDNNLMVDGTINSSGDITATTAAAIILATGSTNPMVAAKDTTNNCYCKVQALDTFGLFGTQSNHDLKIYTNNTDRATFAAGGGLTVVGAFGCNSKGAQTAYASGGALAAYAAGANGLDTEPHMSALHAMVVKIHAALVANGIMS